MEKFTPMAKILQFRRQWRQGQISPLAQGTQGLSFESVSHWQGKTMIGLGSDNKDFRTVKCPLPILTNQTSFVSLNPLVHERHWDKGGLVRKRLDGGAKSALLQPVIIVFPPMKAGRRQRNVISLKSIRPSEEEAAWLDFFFKLLDAHSSASKQIKEGKKGTDVREI